MKYWPNGRSRWLKIDSSPVVKTTLSMRTKNAEKIIFKKKEANIQPFDHQKSLLLHVLFGRGPNKVRETACFDVTAVNLKKVGMASRNIVIKNNTRCYESALQLFQLRPAPPVWPTGISTFFALDGKFPGVGTLELSNPPGWGRKRGQMPRHSFNTATFLTDRTVE